MTMRENQSIDGEGADFYDIAAQFVKETAKSRKPNALLKEWAHRYPQFAADLASIAYAAYVAGDSFADAGDEQDEAVIAAAFKVISPSGSTAKALTSLTNAASSAGMTVKQFATSLRLDIVIVAKLEQRMIDVKTVPTTLLEQIATSIRRSVEDVSSYLAQPPKLAMDARYRSKKPPSVVDTRPQSFQACLLESPTISRADREHWLSQGHIEGAGS